MEAASRGMRLNRSFQKEKEDETLNDVILKKEKRLGRERISQLLTLAFLLTPWPSVAGICIYERNRWFDITVL